MVFLISPGLLLFPDTMPIFYMYSLKRGVAVKPWFLPDETQ